MTCQGFNSDSPVSTFYVMMSLNNPELLTMPVRGAFPVVDTGRQIHHGSRVPSQ